MVILSSIIGAFVTTIKNYHVISNFTRSCNPRTCDKKDAGVGPAADGVDARSPDHPLALAEGILRDELADIAGALDASLKLNESAARAGDSVSTLPGALARVAAGRARGRFRSLQRRQGLRRPKLRATPSPTSE